MSKLQKSKLQMSEFRMAKLQTAVLPIACVMLCAGIAVAQAGPCSGEIAQFEQAIRDSAGNPFAGLSAPQSVAAQMDRQPTPESLKRAQESLKAKFSALMARAKRLDTLGDREGCTSALTEAKRMYIL
jgi:hypothetical protein